MHCSVSLTSLINTSWRNALSKQHQELTCSLIIFGAFHQHMSWMSGEKKCIFISWKTTTFCLRNNAPTLKWVLTLAQPSCPALYVKQVSKRHVYMLSGFKTATEKNTGSAYNPVAVPGKKALQSLHATFLNTDPIHMSVFVMCSWNTCVNLWHSCSGFQPHR